MEAVKHRHRTQTTYADTGHKHTTRTRLLEGPMPTWRGRCTLVSDPNDHPTFGDTAFVNYTCRLSTTGKSNFIRGQDRKLKRSGHRLAVESIHELIKRITTSLIGTGHGASSASTPQPGPQLCPRCSPKHQCGNGWKERWPLACTRSQSPAGAKANS